MNKTPLILLFILVISTFVCLGFNVVLSGEPEGTPYLYKNVTLSKNSTVDMNSPTSTYLNEVTFYEYNDYYRRCFLNLSEVDLGFDNAYTVVNATLYIYYYSSQYGGFPSGSLYACMPTADYSYTTVTWNTKPDYSLIPNGSASWGSYTDGYGYKALNVTDYVKGIMNGTYTERGLMLKAQETHANAFVTMGYTPTGKFTYLEIYVTDNPLNKETEFRIFSGFTGTIIDYCWTTFQALISYISSVITTINSGVYTVVNSITIYFQSWIDLISRVVLNFVADFHNNISQFVTRIIVGYRTGISYVIIKIVNPLITGISQTIIYLHTGLINYISKITSYIFSIPSEEVEDNPLYISVSYLIFLLVLLIPTYAFYNYLGSVAVIPSLMLMSIISYVAGLCNFGVMLIILIVCVAILFRNQIKERL